MMEPITMHRAASQRQYAVCSSRTERANVGLEPMALVAGVSASIQEARITGKASGPFRLNIRSWRRGGSRNQAAIIKAPFVTSTVGISHGGLSTRRYSFATATRSPGTASMITSLSEVADSNKPCRGAGPFGESAHVRHHVQLTCEPHVHDMMPDLSACSPSGKGGVREPEAVLARHLHMLAVGHRCGPCSSWRSI